MKHFNSYLKILLLSAFTTQFTACSKTIEWEEEVPLNTGEVIVLERSDKFDRRSVPGNPFKMGWWINNRSYKFSWQGKNYSYKVQSASGPIILYVYPKENTVAIIDSGWPMCSGYAEFHWRDGKWISRKTINPEIIGRPRNIMDYFSAKEGEIPALVTQEFIRKSHFDAPQRGESLTHLPASKVGNNCTGSKQS